MRFLGKRNNILSLSIALLMPFSVYATTWVGTIETRPTTNEGVWTVGGQDFVVSNTVQVLNTAGSLVKGGCARIEYNTLFGQNVASSIDSVSATQNCSLPAVTTTPTTSASTTTTNTSSTTPTTTTTPTSSTSTTSTTPNVTTTTPSTTTSTTTRSSTTTSTTSTTTSQTASSTDCVTLTGKLTYAYTQNYPDPVQQVIAIDNKGQLREFWRSFNNPIWHLENLSELTRSSILTNGSPTFQRGFYFGSDVQQIFIRDANNNVREFWWTPQRGWKLENLTAQTSGPQAISDPVFQRQENLQQVFVLDSNQYLRELWWTPARGWTIENISQQTNNLKLRSGLSFMRNGYYADGYKYQNFDNVQHIFGVDTEGQLREWMWASQSGWKSSVLKTDYSLIGDPVYYPVFNDTPDGVRDLVYIRNDAGELLQFERIRSSSGFTNIQDWKVLNVSRNVNPNATLSPLDGNLYIANTSQYSGDSNGLKKYYQLVFVRDREGQLIQFRETRTFITNNWKVTGMTTNWDRTNISDMLGGVKISGDPVYGKINNIEYLFALSTSGQLLELWRLDNPDSPQKWQVNNVNNQVCSTN